MNMLQIPAELLLGVMSGVLGTGVSIIKSFKFVHEGEKGVKLRFGRVMRTADGKPRIIEPGFALLIPFVETLKRHHVRQQSYRFPEQRIMLKDGLIYRVSGMILFKVVDIYSALFEINDLDNSVDDISMAALRDELQSRTHDDLHDLAKISESLISRVKERGKQWGIEFLQFSLTECAPTPETANLLNAALAIKMRLDGLKAALEGSRLSLDNIDPSLAAALVGIPVVSSIRSDGAQPIVKTVASGRTQDEAEHPHDSHHGAE